MSIPNREDAEPVSEEHRRHYSKLIKKREKWRAKYAATSIAIREQKNRCARIHNSTNSHALIGLRLYAFNLMLERAQLDAEISNYFYPWVEQDKVEEWKQLQADKQHIEVILQV